MFFIQTGNHHLFLILRTQSHQEWIVLLGKRKPNFPFIGTRFENTTLYNVSANKLYHCVEEEMKDLHFEYGENWKISGKRPIEFSLTLHPGFLAKRSKLFKKIVFQYHTLSLISGEIGDQTIARGHGFSEQGKLSLLPFKKLQLPFRYLLLLKSMGQGGEVEWKALPILKDRFCWGNTQIVSGHASLEVLTQMAVPLKSWTLHREIVRGAGEQNQVCYGLREHFRKTH